MREKIPGARSRRRPSTPQRYLEHFCPIELVEDERGVVGVWWLEYDVPDEETDERGRPKGRSNMAFCAVRTKSNRPYASWTSTHLTFDERLTSTETWRQFAVEMSNNALDGPSGSAADSTFLGALVRLGIAGSPSEWHTVGDPVSAADQRFASLPPVHRKMAEAVARHYPASGDVIGIVEAHVGDRIERFCATLDQDAVAYACREDIPAVVDAALWYDTTGRQWLGIDATFTEGAPLRRLLEAAPQHGDLFIKLWMSDRNGLDDAPADALRRALGHVSVDASPALCRAVLDAGTSLAEACNGVRFTPDEQRDMVDPRTHFRSDRVRYGAPTMCLLLLSALPVDWVPSGLREWRALVGIVKPLLVSARSAPGGRPGRSLVNSRGRWERFADRLARACGGADLDAAVDDVEDMVHALARQVIAPAVSRAGPGLSRGFHGSAFMAAVREFAFGGLGLPALLETSRRWHARQAGIDAVLDAISPSSRSGWGAGLPDWAAGGVEIAVLTDATMLAEEGAKGKNPDGSHGLHHCVGGYSDLCRSGSSRILSVRRRSREGGVERLSTAQIDVRKDGGRREYRVEQHRGGGNFSPPDVAVRTLDEYLAGCRSGRLKVREDELAPLPASTSVEGRCGYDWSLPGNVEKAMEAWTSFLPRPLRGLPPEQMAHLFLARTSE